MKGKMKRKHEGDSKSKPQIKLNRVEVLTLDAHVRFTLQKSTPIHKTTRYKASILSSLLGCYGVPLRVRPLSSAGRVRVWWPNVSTINRCHLAALFSGCRNRLRAQRRASFSSLASTVSISVIWTWWFVLYLQYVTQDNWRCETNTWMEVDVNHLGTSKMTEARKTVGSKGARERAPIGKIR